MKTPALTGGDDLLKESGLDTSYIILLNDQTCTQRKLTNRGARAPIAKLSVALSDSCELEPLTLYTCGCFVLFNNRFGLLFTKHKSCMIPFEILFNKGHKQQG